MKNTKVGRSSAQISKETGVKEGSVRTSLLSLRSLNLVKIVGYEANPTGEPIQSYIKSLKVNSLN